MNSYNIIIAGVGGQGVILAGNIIGDAAIALGYDVKKTDTIGMAQRGGSVISHLRVAPKIYSPVIGEGQADIVISFEKMEAARCFSFLKPGGTVILNNREMPPLSVSCGMEQYPSDEEIMIVLEQKTDSIYFVEGSKKSEAIGNIKVLNIFMLGCLSQFMDIEDKVWRESIIRSLPAKIVGINITAFEAGIESVKL
ncbi:MAG: indolepyruvate oxidoreductase subunit beta [Dehalococcoidales bacterium]|nr:indolepyruvate oxidoreductase subunit beta [Dehalococcoidales bacterium]